MSIEKNCIAIAKQDSLYSSYVESIRTKRQVRTRYSRTWRNTRVKYRDAASIALAARPSGKWMFALRIKRLSKRFNVQMCGSHAYSAVTNLIDKSPMWVSWESLASKAVWHFYLGEFLRQNVCTLGIANFLFISYAAEIIKFFIFISTFYPTKSFALFSVL